LSKIRENERDGIGMMEMVNLRLVDVQIKFELSYPIIYNLLHSCSSLTPPPNFQRLIPSSPKRRRTILRTPEPRTMN
jgi:hypothetical protein